MLKLYSFAAAALLLALPAASAGPDPSPYGINGVVAIHARTSPNAIAKAKSDIRLMREAGIRWDRIEIWWSVVEPEKGKWDFEFTDRVVALYKDSGVSPLAILNYSSAWSGKPPADDGERQAFARYAAKMIGRYKDTIKCWEVWNEPNIPTFWPTPNVKDYAELLKVTYKAAKEADPECVIIAGSTSGPDFGFIRGIFDNGAWDSCDAISIHPYSMAGGPGSQRLGELLEMANDCIASTGKDKPLWITEMGWTSSSSEEDARQAAYLTQSYVIAAVQGVDKLFWFKLEDWSEKWGIVKADGTKKPAYKAYQTLTKNLTSPVLVGPLQLAPELEGYLFRIGDSSLFVTWSRYGTPVSAALPVGSGSKVMNALGEPVSLKDARAAVGDMPVFVLEPGAHARLEAARSRRRPIRPYPDGNRLLNASFERGSGSEAWAWNQGVFDGQQKKGEFFAGVGRSGRAAGIRKAEDAAWDSWPVPVRWGKDYLLTGWAKVNGPGGKVTAGIHWYSGNQWTWKSADVTDEIPADGLWHEFSVRGKAPEGAVLARIRLTAKDVEKEAIFDDLFFAPQN